MNTVRSKRLRVVCAKPTVGRRWQSGSSVLIVLVLLACMAVMLAANSATLALLKEELKAIDQQQRQKYGQGPRH